MIVNCRLHDPITPIGLDKQRRCDQSQQFCISDQEDTEELLFLRQLTGRSIGQSFRSNQHPNLNLCEVCQFNESRRLHYEDVPIILPVASPEFLDIINIEVNGDILNNGIEGDIEDEVVLIIIEPVPAAKPAGIDIEDEDPEQVL